MTASRMFARPPSRQPAAMWMGLIMAVLAATALLSNFVDALHVSMARGEALRAAHRLTPSTLLDTDKPSLVVLAPMQRGVR